jgi:hypothetical protein
MRVASLHLIKFWLIDEALAFNEGGNETGRFVERASFTERPQRGLDNLHSALKGGIRVKDQAEPHLCGLLAPNNRCLATNDHIKHLRNCEPCGIWLTSSSPSGASTNVISAPASM